MIYGYFLKVANDARSPSDLSSKLEAADIFPLAFQQSALTVALGSSRYFDSYQQRASTICTATARARRRFTGGFPPPKKLALKELPISPLARHATVCRPRASMLQRMRAIGVACAFCLPLSARCLISTADMQHTHGRAPRRPLRAIIGCITAAAMIDGHDISKRRRMR